MKLIRIFIRNWYEGCTAGNLSPTKKSKLARELAAAASLPPHGHSNWLFSSVKADRGTREIHFDLTDEAKSQLIW